MNKRAKVVKSLKINLMQETGFKLNTGLDKLHLAKLYQINTFTEQLKLL